MFKRIISTILMVAMMASIGTSVMAEGKPIYKITDEHVVIDSVFYKIVDNTIKYDGLTYEIIDYTLVSYDEDGSETLLILPIEQNKITDTEKIAELNANLEKNNQLSRDIPSSSVDLPYSAVVPDGQWFTETPAVNIIDGEFYYGTSIKLSDLPWFSKKIFTVTFSYCDPYGTWYSHQNISNHDFRKVDTLKYKNLSSMRYGIFMLGNLYEEYSYRYTISLHKIAF